VMGSCIHSARTHEREARHDRLHRLFGHRTSPVVPCMGIRPASTH
jgi:hypothetical protein